MDVQVVMCNDSPEHAVLGTEAAAQECLEELREAYWQRNRHSFRDQEEYNARCYWHVRTVAGEYRRARGEP